MITINITELLAIIGLITILSSPIIYIYCIKPNKSLKDGLKDWIDEGADDL